MANTPYAAMLFLGAATVLVGFGFSGWPLAGAGAYLVYGVAGAFWTMVFICPFCAYFATRGCPCGYGMIAARLVRKADRECFAEKFRRHIPVIVPLWLIPVIAGGVALWRSPSWWLAALVAAFVVNSYVILPLVSRRHSCTDCPQRQECPWMGEDARPAGASVPSARRGNDH